MDEMADDTAKILESERLKSEATKNQEKNAALEAFTQGREGSLDYVTGGNTTGSASASGQSNYELANQKVVTATKNAEIDAVTGTTIGEMQESVRKLAEEKARKDRKQAHNLEQDAFGGQGTQGPSLEQKGPAGDKTHLKNTAAFKKSVAEQLKQDEAEAKRLNDRHNAQINNPTSDDIAEKGKLQLAKEKAEKESDIRSDNHFNKNQVPINPSMAQDKTALQRTLAQNERNEFLADLNANAERNGRLGDTADDIAPPSTFGNNSRRKGRYSSFMTGRDEDGELGNPFRFSTLAYPRNATNNMANGHYLLFYVNVQNKTGFKYEGVTPSDGEFSVGNLIESLVTKERYVEGSLDAAASGLKEDYSVFKYDKRNGKQMKGSVDYEEREILAGRKGNILRHNQKILSRGRKALTGMESVHKTTTRITDSVALYLPGNVTNDTSVSYQDFETGMAGFLALGGKGDILDKILKNDYMGAAGNLMGMTGTVLAEMLKKAGIASVQAFTGGQGIQNAFDKAFGQTLNPYLEVAFNSMGVRSFQYTFTFSPKNEDESLDAKAIIELFRFHMAPELKGSDQHRYLTLPSTFDIHYMYQTSPENSRENTFYNKIATCVLTKVDVDYTPTGVKSFDSGAPVTTTMTLNFMETEMLTKEKIQQGF